MEGALIHAKEWDGMTSVSGPVPEWFDAWEENNVASLASRIP